MKTKFKVIDRFQIAGIVISIAISITLLAMKQDSITSILVGLTLAILTQLFDLQIRLNSSEEAILLATNLNQVLYEDKQLLHLIQKILNDYESIKLTEFRLFEYRAKTAIDECKDLLNSMANGVLLTRHDNLYSIRNVCFSKVKKILKIVTTTDISKWCTDPCNEKYIQEYVSAVNRGIKIIHIFIVPKERLEEVLDTLAEHIQACNGMFIISLDDLPNDFNEEYLIVDNYILTKIEFNSNGNISGEKISINETEVEQMINRFDILKKYARTFEEIIEKKINHKKY